jgi:glycosyltransferase involved in cell wall biosynthesis
MVPLYLPLTLDEADQSQGTPVFFGGINVYLDQQFGWYRRWTPPWFRKWLSSPVLLRWASGRAAKTRAADVGELTLSMLRGEDGNQARDLAELVAWLEPQPHPDLVCLSNSMLLGMASELRRHLRTPVVCMLQGEDAFLDELLPTFRNQAWEILAERAMDADLFVTPSRFFAAEMERRLKLAPDRIRIVPNGISLEGYPTPRNHGRAECSGMGSSGESAADARTKAAPHIGYFARMCRDKGLDLLVEAFIILRRRGRVSGARLRIGGGCGPSDEALVKTLQDKLGQAGLAEEVEWLKNPDREAKLSFLTSLRVFSVPARCGEAFGLYVIEALAAGVPVVLPRSGAFVELVEQSGGGMLCEAGDAESLAQTLEAVLLDEDLRGRLASAGQTAAHRDYGVTSMVQNLLSVFREVSGVVSGGKTGSPNGNPVVSCRNVQ